MSKTTVGISIITGQPVEFVDVTNEGLLEQLRVDLEDRRASERSTLHRMIYPSKNRQTLVTL